MNISGSIQRKVIKELVHQSRYPFEKSCIEIIRLFLDELVDSKELGHFERTGVDAYTYDISNERMGSAFQFKGFEVMTFGNSQKKQCIKSIESFSRTNEKFENYFLIVNLPITDRPLREEIEQSMKASLTNVVVRQMTLLDVNQFVKWVGDEYEEIVLTQLEMFTRDNVAGYRQTVDQSFYYPDVPFIDKNRRSKTSPITSIEKNILSNGANKLNMHKWTFILSEFGFGKTSLVHYASERFQETQKVNTIYVPVASLSSTALSTTTDICKEITRLIFVLENSNPRFLPYMILHSVMKNILLNSTNMVVIFDGLDEHPSLYSFNGLKHFFNSLMEFTTPILLTLRSEFWSERNYEITSSIKRATKNISIIQLEEWSDKNILEYLDRLVSNSGGSESLVSFYDLVQNGRYEEYFGDIPRRPLFLMMLVEDLQYTGLKKYNIAMLYENYFLRKIKVDITGFYNPSKRPLSLEGGYINQVKTIVGILEKIAYEMTFKDEEGNIQLTEQTSETEIDSIISESPFDDIVELLLHSVLMPTGVKRLSGFNLRFAHRSFQEYFLARYIKNHDLDPEELTLPSSVSKFINALDTQNTNGLN